ncbi:MAG: glycosyltransferase family 2 protein [Clostridiales bacterium]|nr:glycosyltransferase family 2 protein [Clostridiales bacterium]
MREELVSVVIPTYARPKLLPRALKSVLAQTHEALDIIVVDDNANDTSARDEVARVVRDIGDPRVRLVQNEKNLGGALSRNAGITEARAQYIAFLDDDDEYLPRKVEMQLERFKRSELEKLALVYCHTQMIGEGTEVLQEYRYTFRGHCVFEGMRDCIAATSQWMCRRDALEDVGCFSDVPCKQDSTVLVKLLVNGYTVDYVPEILSRYNRDAAGGISAQGHQKRIQGEEALRALCRRHYDLITASQQREVEYSFAIHLIAHYHALGLREQYRAERDRILAHPLRRKSLGIMKQIMLNR